MVLAGYSGSDFAKVMESLYNVRATKCVNSMSRNSVYNDLFLTNHRKDRTKSQNKVAKSTMQTSAPAPKPEIPIESATSKVDTKSQVENAILSSLPQITNMVLTKIKLTTDTKSANAPSYVQETGFVIDLVDSTDHKSLKSELEDGTEEPTPKISELESKVIEIGKCQDNIRSANDFSEDLTEFFDWDGSDTELTPSEMSNNNASKLSSPENDSENLMKVKKVRQKPIPDMSTNQNISGAQDVKVWNCSHCLRQGEGMDSELMSLEELRAHLASVHKVKVVRGKNDVCERCSLRFGH